MQITKHATMLTRFLCCILLTACALQAADITPRTNEMRLNLVKSWAKEAKAPIRTVGTGSFRIMLVGRMPGNLDTATMLKAGETALKGLDTWTGKTGIMATGKLAENRVSWLVLLDANGRFDQFLKWARNKHEGMRHNGNGDDLVARYRSLVGQRVSIATIERVTVQRSIHYAIYVATNQAVDTYFRERGHKAPTWLREGFNAELQRLIPDGDPIVLWRTVAYEDNDKSVGTDWAGALKAAIKEGRKDLYSAIDVMRAEAISLDAIHYVQLWSFTSYLVATARSQKGEKNKLHLLIEMLGTGADSERAVKAIYGKEDPTLSRAWFRWASSK